jgi:hypothetical protein
VRANWGAVIVGGVAGLATGVVLALPLLAIGLAATDTFTGQAVLLLVGFASQLAAGYVAARFSGADHAPALHGGMAALILYAEIGGISIAAGSDPSTGTLAFGAFVALVLGTSGGVLAAALSQRET